MSIKHIALVISIMYFAYAGNAQESISSEINKIENRIDSLHNEVKKIQSVIAELQDSITTLQTFEQIAKSKDINDGKGIEVDARVNKDYGPFNLYESLGKNEIGKIPINSKIIVYGKIDNYYKVGYKNKIGYVSASYLKLDPEIESLFGDSKISTSNDFNYSKPATSSKSSYNSGEVHVKGHYRTTKSGKTIYVKPHKRSKPKKNN